MVNRTTTKDTYLLCPECKGEGKIYTHYDKSYDLNKVCEYCNGKRLIYRRISISDEVIE
jgi:excinuclease UvrABC ATPase subunit